MTYIALLMGAVCLLALPAGGIWLLSRVHERANRFSNLFLASYVSGLLIAFVTWNGNYLATMVLVVVAPICLLLSWPRTK